MERYRILNKLFYYLSEGKTLLTEETLQTTIMKLPLPCMNAIQSIVKKIYQGETMEWLDFLEQFNDEKVKGKEAFFGLITKWFARSDVI